MQFANQAASTVDGSPVDVMLVDPATLSRTLHWQSDWGPSPAGLVDDLARAPSAPLPVIVTPDLAGSKALLIGGVRVPTHVLASVRAFPFMAEGTPLAITSYDALDEFEARTKAFDSLGVLSTYVWGKGPPAQVGRALTALEPTYPPATIETYLRAPDVVLATRTFTFMRMIAIGVGVLALLGLLLYLQSRQRSQAIASALARRMGLTRTAETLSRFGTVCRWIPRWASRPPARAALLLPHLRRRARRRKHLGGCPLHRPPQADQRGVAHRSQPHPGHRPHRGGADPRAARRQAAGIRLPRRHHRRP